ncbi:hypothetical protein H1P_150064 [Hyella patelloides LEGE 07179]|uniref:Uncharacterized protein n=1 Tax=Hyella patelloides LEGE 07179 TaxID=945734 RepID=A0A563VM22_9CYAN|nr:hypothetical protein H1P_150064 [Hyella patelloides LEGE 07179]
MGSIIKVVGLWSKNHGRIVNSRSQKSEVVMSVVLPLRRRSEDSILEYILFLFA